MTTQRPTIEELREKRDRLDQEAREARERAERLAALAEDQRILRSLEREWALENGCIDGTDGEWW